VPVVVRNFKDEDGNSPNEEDDDSNWRLFRRFFIYDTVSGIEGEGDYARGGISTVIRYPKSITLRVKLDSINEEMIYVPQLIIEYRERSQTVIESYTLSDVTFTSEYAMDTSNFWESVKILFIVLNVFFGVILVVQVIVWCQTP